MPTSAKENFVASTVAVRLETAITNMVTCIDEIVKNPEYVGDLTDESLSLLIRFLPVSRTGNSHRSALEFLIEIWKALPLANLEERGRIEKHAIGELPEGVEEKLSEFNQTNYEELMQGKTLKEIEQFMQLVVMKNEGDGVDTLIYVYNYINDRDIQSDVASAVASAVRDIALKTIEHEYHKMTLPDTLRIGFDLTRLTTCLRGINEEHMDDLIDVERVRQFITEAQSWVRENPDNRRSVYLEHIPECLLPHGRINFGAKTNNHRTAYLV